MLRPVCFLLVLALVGCAHPTQRVGPTIPLGSLEPANKCERKNWLRLAPAKTVTLEQKFTDKGVRPLEATGLALFDAKDHAVELRELVPKMGEPALNTELQRVVVPAYRRQRETYWWLLASTAGLAVMFGSAVAGSALGDGKHLGAAAIAGMSVGGAASLTADVMGIIRMPKRSQRMEWQLRATMFVEGEYERADVERGTLRLLESIRKKCAAD